MSGAVAVVGGGLAGLVCALTLARAGRAVTVFDRAPDLGGRARTQRRDGFALNLGPHALYRAGTARRLLDAHAIPAVGRAPPAHALALRGGSLAGPLPFTPWHALTTPLLSAAERWAVARWFAGVAVARPEALRGTSVADWLGPLPNGAREVAAALVRVATYAHAPEALDAGAALAQVQRALHGVDYLDGGWQRLVDALAEAVRAAGATITLGAAVREVRPRQVVTDAGRLDCDAVVLAVGPHVAAALTGSRALAEIAARTLPVTAACLDVALAGPLDPARRFALGVDRPLYVATHSDVATELAPPGASVVHAALYGGGERDELEAALDALHPGWRGRVVRARWMPDLVVAHDLPRAAVHGRRAPHELDGFHLAGDWVGDEGMLADAAVASADHAAREILRAAQEAA